MNQNYGRDLDLNLLRVFVVVAETRSVTRAADQLYLTQPAVSAALRRLTTAIGAPLFTRQGRGVVLTTRGERLLGIVQPMLRALVDAVLEPPAFDPKTSERTIRLGLADAAEGWLLPPLLRALEREAPRMRLAVLPVQFRTVEAALSNRVVDIAVTVADALAADIRRRELYFGGFVCVFDPRHLPIKKTLTEAQYFDCEHVIVSYNGDFRGVVEDTIGKTRKIRCSVPSFANVGAIVDDSALLATVPTVVANQILATRPHLRTVEKPFSLTGAPIEMLWSSVTDDDDSCRFVRDRIARLGSAPPLGKPMRDVDAKVRTNDRARGPRRRTP